eukprot:gene26875-biopygen17460
MSRGGCSRTES